MRQTKRLSNLLIAMLLFTSAASLLQSGRTVTAKSMNTSSRAAALYQDSPGLSISGYVLLENDQGLPGATIFRTLAVHWPGAQVATTGADGFYQSAFFDIPGDETVTVHAERACYTFLPEYVTWRHYYGHEVKEINFTAYPAPCLHFYMPILQSSTNT
jgi:hypothetical protein